MSFLMIIHLEHPKTLRTVPKLCPKFVRNIETYLLYFLCYKFFRRFLHTVEVRGSSPLSPTTPLPKTRSLFVPLNGVRGIRGIRKYKQSLATRLCISETPSERLHLDCARGRGQRALIPFHRPQVFVEPGQGFLDVIISERAMVAFTQHEPLVFGRSPQKVEHGFDLRFQA
jgi:hypothetical protein